MEQYKIFRFLKQIFVSTMMFFVCNVSGVNLLNAVPRKCVSMNNSDCKVRSEIININSSKPHFILIVLK